MSQNGGYRSGHVPKCPAPCTEQWRFVTDSNEDNFINSRWRKFPTSKFPTSIKSIFFMQSYKFNLHGALFDVHFNSIDNVHSVTAAQNELNEARTDT